jgi:hypothetical protein
MAVLSRNDKFGTVLWKQVLPILRMFQNISGRRK